MITRPCRSSTVAVVLTALLAACHSAPTRLFTVEPLARPSTPAPYDGPVIRVDGVHLPPALDRAEIMVKVAPGEFEVIELDQWMVPLGQSVRQALTADLAAQLPEGRVIFPHLAKPPGTLGISVDILAFDADGRGAQLQVSWLGTTDETQPPTHGGAMVLQTTQSGAGAASMASALSLLVAQLADHIVAELSQPTVGASTSGDTHAKPSP